MQDNDKEKRARCRQCTEPLSANSTALCEKHLIANRERGRADRERRKLLGICRSCTEPISPDSKTWCVKHHELQNKASREWANKMRSKELCVDCSSEPRLMRKKRCVECQKRYDEKQDGVCRRLGCEAPVDPTLKHFCRTHGDEENEKLRTRRQKMKEQKVCLFCFSDIEDGPVSHVLCETCRNKQKEQRKLSTSR